MPSAGGTGRGGPALAHARKTIVMHSVGRPVGSPAVSVVISVYNGERFLRQAIESVLAQSLGDLELVAVDDGSTDASWQILNDYASSDSRIAIHRQANQGRAAALNRGITLARAPYVARLDADDIALPNRFERQRQFLAEHELVAVVGGAVTFVDEHGRAFAGVEYPLADSEIRNAFAYTTPLAHPAVMLRRDVFRSLGGYRTLFREAEDLDLWLRIGERRQLANLPELVICYRMHGGQATVQRLEAQSLESVAARAAARARAEGAPDPLEGAARINRQLLLAMGVSEDEITSTLVHSQTWLAKTMSRAGYRDAAEELFAAAADRARSASGSSGLVAYVHHERARREAEQGHRLRTAVYRVQAEFADRRSG